MGLKPSARALWEECASSVSVLSATAGVVELDERRSYGHSWRFGEGQEPFYGDNPLRASWRLTEWQRSRPRSPGHGYAER